MKWEISNNKNKVKLAVIVALVAFSTVFLLTGALLTTVYGMSKTYNETLQITKNVTSQTEGYLINSYMGDVKYNICEVLLTNTNSSSHQAIAEYEECMRI